MRVRRASVQKGEAKESKKTELQSYSDCQRERNEDTFMCSPLHSDAAFEKKGIFFIFEASVAETKSVLINHQSTFI